MDRAPGPMPRTCTVIIVDDDDSVRDSTQALLGAVGYPTECYASGGAFLNARSNGNDACVLLDVWMPEIGGLEVLKALQVPPRGPPAIMMAGSAEVETAVRAMQLGAFGFLHKPFIEVELLEIIEHTILFTRDAGYRISITEAARQKLVLLTQREHQAMVLLLSGQSNAGVAREMACSLHSAEILRTRILVKMAANSLTQLARVAFLAGVRIAET